MNASVEIKHITLRVGDLARSIGFYVEQLGFIIHAQTPKCADLATAANGGPILRLIARPDATVALPSQAGLYHAALLFPNRAALGSWLRHAAKHEVEFDGFSDHGVSEAIYFSDPDGNGLEFYADRPHDVWPLANGGIEMTTRPLDIQSLLAASPDLPSVPLVGAKWGHVHLRVRDLDRSEQFYCDALGMKVTQRNYPGARFIAADGYHHHIGLNVWGHPRESQPPGALGLESVTFGLHGATVPREMQDPDGIRSRIEPLG